MKKGIVFTTLVLSFLFISSACSKKCGDCPENHYLTVDNPKDGECICCPEGTVYEGGYCY